VHNFHYVPQFSFLLTEELPRGMEAGKVLFQTGSAGILQCRAIIRSLGAFGRQYRKDHAGRLAALAAVAPGQEFQHFKNLRFGQALKARLDPAPIFPGFIDFLPEPLQDLVRFIFIFQGVDGNPVRVNGDQLSVNLESSRGRILRIRMPSQGRIEIGENFTDVPIEVSYAMKGLEIRVTFGPKNLFAITF